MTARDHQPRCAEYGRRSQHGTDIVRVRHLVEHDQGPAVRRLLSHILQARLFQRLDLHHDALVHGIGAEQPVQVAWRHLLGVNPRAFIGSRSRASAFSVITTREMRRSGLRSAASTAWMP